MLQTNAFSQLPCTKEDFSAISKRGHFCFPPYDPCEDDDPVSLDIFFCHAIEESEASHFIKTYKLIENNNPNNILALASISNFSISFNSYESKPTDLRDSGYNDAFPAVMLNAFGVRNDLQNKGFGVIAFEKLTHLIRTHSIAGARILALHPLESAVSFYQRQGCIPVFSEEDDDEVDLMYLDIWHKP